MADSLKPDIRSDEQRAADISAAVATALAAQGDRE